MIATNLLKISFLLAFCALQKVSGELDLTKHGRIDNNEEGFAKLCAIEEEAKNEYEAHVGTVEEGEYRRDYLSAMEIRGVLGSKIGRLICPTAISADSDKYKRLRSSFNRKCAREAQSESMCVIIRLARQTSRVQVKAMVAKEHSLCQQYSHFKRAREQFGKKHKLLFCDQGVVVPAKLRGRNEAHDLISKWNSERGAAKKLNSRCWDRLSRVFTCIS